MTVAELLTWAVKQLPGYEDYLSIDILLTHTLNKSRSFLYANPEHMVSGAEEQQFKNYFKRFLQGEPIAYLTQKREFWSLSLKVTPDTLIPRQETELLVEWALKLLPDSSCLVADLGTGSGAIALALGFERPHWKIIATDKSLAALKVAEENAKNLNITNIIFVEGNWFSCHSRVDGNPFSTIEPERKFDLIISNPPYLAEEELHSGLSFEPHSALVAKEAGLGDIRHIISKAWHYLKQDGYLLIEHGYQQAEKVRSIFLEVGYNDIKMEYDLAGRERITWGRRG